MNVPLWVSEAARAFWQEAGGPEPFPRTLRRPITLSPFDVTVKDLAGLSVRGLDRYLAGLDIVWTCDARDRPLRACLVARDGAGWIFLDATDEPGEQVFSLAHELAHFLRHYWGPRCRACRRLGDRAAEVLDGRRPPTPAERARALLADVSLGPYVHLMRRGPRRGEVSAAVAVAEEEADRLAYELLAPAAAVAAQAGAGRTRVAEVLRQVFGLPAARAGEYSRLLLPVLVEDPLLRRLRGKS